MVTIRMPEISTTFIRSADDYILLIYTSYNTIFARINQRTPIFDYFL